jgi:AbrB family looped-hinge helix DNA binding protein
MTTDQLVIATVKVHGRGRVQIPKEVRQILNIEDGDRIYLIQDASGRIFLKKAPTLKKVEPRKYVVTA